ncbi:type II toxin-antitoxin system RelE/ParE family toxin [Candidatus Avelusimicrobium fimicolum]|uniref:type II toxin-antitoxin system RelE/ParE family toxin n=2 Tax=Candidatus Avelusimicrobium fimicolum TaxID=3416216 RepID=UPI003D14DC75
MIMKEIRYFTLQNKAPVVEWQAKLGSTERAIVKNALYRLAAGNTGKAKNLKGGLWELRLHISSGYRIYFAYEGDQLIILLHAGDKSTQKKDIEKARSYLTVWREIYENY